MMSKIKSGQTDRFVRHFISLSVCCKTRAGGFSYFLLLAALIVTNLLRLRFLTGRDDFSMVVQSFLQAQQFVFRFSKGKQKDDHLVHESLVGRYIVIEQLAIYVGLASPSSGAVFGDIYSIFLSSYSIVFCC